MLDCEKIMRYIFCNCHRPARRRRRWRPSPLSRTLSASVPPCPQSPVRYPDLCARGGPAFYHFAAMICHYRLEVIGLQSGLFTNLGESCRTKFFTIVETEGVVWPTIALQL